MAKKRSKNAVEVNVEAENFKPEAKPELLETNAQVEPYIPAPDQIKTPKNRLSLPIRPDGTIDTDSMRQDTLRKVKDVLSDPRSRELLGIAPGAPLEVVSEQDVKMFYDLVGTIEAYAFNLAGKIDWDLAQKHARWDEAQKNMVVAPTQRVIAKHADKMAWMVQWKDEVVLSLLLVTITRAKYETARKEQNSRDVEKKKDNPATQPAVVSEQVTQ